MGATDCELLRDAFLAQPVNALSSLALVIAGVVIIRRHPGMRMHAVLGFSVVLVGVGSFLFHGPQPAGSRSFHDWADFTAAVAVAALASNARPSWGRQTPLRITAVASVFALAITFSWPESGQWLVGAAAVVAAAGLVRRWSRARWGVGVFAAGAALLVLGRTDGPLCAPESVIQPHAAWHVLAAVGFVLLAAALVVEDLSPAGSTR